MPNTLAHLGIQAITTRKIIRSADLKWIYLGCIIPDIPWIFSRIVRFLGVGINLYDLRLYLIIQSSLFFALILCFGFAALSRNFKMTFIILGLNSLFHLLLDALQIKWGNGVILWAPFNWTLLNFGYFWPESVLTYILTILGFIYFFATISKNINKSLKFEDIIKIRTTIFSFCIIIYLFLPLIFMQYPESKNNHFIKTLRDYNNRSSKYIEIDRSPYLTSQNGNLISTFADEQINVEGIPLNESAVVSIQGFFLTNNRIKVLRYHVHTFMFRDFASVLGLLLVMYFWGHTLVRAIFFNFKKS